MFTATLWLSACDQNVAPAADAAPDGEALGGVSAVLGSLDDDASVWSHLDWDGEMDADTADSSPDTDEPDVAISGDAPADSPPPSDLEAEPSDDGSDPDASDAVPDPGGDTLDATLSVCSAADADHPDCPRFVDASAAWGLGAFERSVSGSLGIFGPVGLVDVDGDDHLDLLTVGEGFLFRYYRNDGDGQLVDQTDGAGLAGVVTPKSLAVGDIDNDGDADLVVVGAEASYLFANDGAGRFEDATAQWGLTGMPRQSTVSFVDFNNDGLLDLYEAAWGADRINRLYVNEGPGFARLASSPGNGLSRDDRGASLSAIWTDLDGDGWQDLWLVNDYGYFAPPSSLYLNRGPDPEQPLGWLFEDVGAETGFRLPILGMGSAIGDIDNDLEFEFYAANIANNPLLVLDRDPDTCANAHGFCATDRGADMGVSSGFVSLPDQPPTWPPMDPERAASAGLPAYCEAYCPADYEDNWALVSWTPVFADFDHDGWSDLFVTNGVVGASFMAISPDQPNRLFMNEDGQLVGARPGFIPDDPNDSRSAAAGDLDGDGDIDLVYLNNPREGPPGVVVLENRAASGHWLGLDLVGTESNRDAIGARVVVHSGDLTMLRQVEGGHGYASVNQRGLHFGLGDNDQVDRIEITWPMGTVQVLEDVAGDQRLTITEPIEE